MMHAEWRRRLTAPWVCEHPTTSPAVLLAAKLLVVYAMAGRWRHGFDAPFLPFVAWLDAPAVAAVWPWFLGGLFWAGAVAVLGNLAPRAGMAAAGAALTLDIIASRVRFSNSELLFGVLLLVFSLTEREERTRWLVRGQLALVYGGAAINKLLAEDWRNGRFFAHWAGEVLGLEWYLRLDTALSGGASWFLGWFTIGLELVLAGLALRPSATRVWVMLGVGFHAGMLVFSAGAISWVFLFVMSAGFTALADERPGAVLRMRPWWCGTAWIIFGLGYLLRRWIVT